MPSYEGVHGLFDVGWRMPRDLRCETFVRDRKSAANKAREGGGLPREGTSIKSVCPSGAAASGACAVRVRCVKTNQPAVEEEASQLCNETISNKVPINMQAFSI